MPFLNSNPVEIVLQDRDQRINISLFDEDNNPVDATELSLQVLDVSKKVVYEDSYLPLTPPTRIIKPAATTGEYYISWGDESAPANTPDQTETDDIQDLFFIWRAVGATGTEAATILQVLKVVDPLVLSYLPRFRLQIDKAAKIVSETDNIFLGFTDAQLLMYLEGGLNIINSYQPNTFLLLEQFPLTHLQLLLDVGTLVALQSQSLYAVDTDIPSYNDQGYGFSIDHFPKLQQFMGTLQQRIDRLVPLFKLSWATMGTLHIEGGTSYRLQSLISASMPGALFRGFLTR